MRSPFSIPSIYFCILDSTLMVYSGYFCLGMFKTLPQSLLLAWFEASSLNELLLLPGAYVRW
jgi:hypothetical protein